MQFNKYSLYSIQNGMETSLQDEVDTLVEGVKLAKGYNELKNYLEKHFDNFEGIKWVAYEKLNKKIYMKIEEKTIEFCALKNNKQYFGKGFDIVQKDKNNN